MMPPVPSHYYGDARDVLESIYPTCTSFVQFEPASVNSERWVEVALDLQSAEAKELFGIICYLYEDSYDWEQIPLVVRRSAHGAISRFKGGKTVHSMSLVEGRTRFEILTDELKKA